MKTREHTFRNEGEGNLFSADSQQTLEDVQGEDDRLSDALVALNKQTERLKQEQEMRRQEVQAADKALNQAKHDHMKGSHRCCCFVFTKRRKANEIFFFFSFRTIRI